MKARTERILIEDVGQECIVYDLDTKKAHCLNSSLKWIWSQCDGSRRTEEIAADFERKFESDDAGAHVRAGLEQLAAVNLLAGDIQASDLGQPQVTRRNVLTAASLAVPVLTSILVPTPAAAKSKEDKDPKDKGPKDKPKKP